MDEPTMKISHSRRDIPVLTDNKSYHICSGCTAAATEGHSDTQTGHRASDKGAQQLAVGHGQLVDEVLRYHLRQNAEEQGGHEHSVYGLGSECLSESLDTYDQQHQVDGEEGIADRYGAVGGILDDGTDTGYSSADDTVGDDEDTPSSGIAEKTQGNDQIVIYD